MSPLKLTVSAAGVEVMAVSFEGGRLELGRQGKGERVSEELLDLGSHSRLVIAEKGEDSISHRHALLSRLAEDRLAVEVSSEHKSVFVLTSSETVGPGGRVEVVLPVALGIGALRVEIAAHSQTPTPLSELRRLPARQPASAPPAGDLARLIEWVADRLDPLHEAADEEEFFDRAARAAAEMIGLDYAAVLTSRGAQLQVRAMHCPNVLAGCNPSQRVLAQVQTDRRTIYESPPASPDAGSLLGIELAVASPVLGRQGQVVAVVYGVRRSGRPEFRSFTDVEALLVELLARSVAAGLARRERAIETARAEMVALFGSVFTPEVASEVAANPDLLRGRQAEVTVLFCDVRGFSRISESLGPTKASLWCGDVLEALTEEVFLEKGVLVDYTGDGLMALWGAPGHQPDHAARACRAALRMQAALPALGRRWKADVAEPLRLSVGVNTGEAIVGDAGTKKKPKYGARGNTVNVGSRIEGSTKHLWCDVVVSAATKARLGDVGNARRLGQIKVVNVKQPVEVYELLPTDHPALAAARESFERALGQYERREFGGCCATLNGLLQTCPADGAAVHLLYRARQAELMGVPSEHPLYVLSGK